MKLLMLKGLPASGKSTYATELVKEGWTRVNKDELRLLMHGGKWSRGNESEVITARDDLIINALEKGKNVVVDDTNYALVHEAHLHMIALEYKADFEVKEFDTDVEECIKRDLHRGEKAVGEQVIRKMWREYVAVPKTLSPDYSLPNAVIFDIDGTLAIKSNRSPYDWEKVGEDTLNYPVASLLDILKDKGYKVLIFSGRDSVCRDTTKWWLASNGIDWEELYMRPEGDTRKDVEVKAEFYEACKDRYNITFVVDDRPQVCRYWHTQGLCLLKVGDPDLDF